MSRPVASLTLIATAVIWGLAFVAQKSAMQAMGPLTFTAVRYLLGGLVILPLAIREYRRRKADLTPRQWGAILLLGLSFFMGAWLQQVGLTMTTVTNSGFLTALYVLLTPMLGLVVLRMRPHVIVWFCVPLALAGIYLLNGGHLDRINLGDALNIGGAFFWALQVLTIGLIARSTGLPIFISVTSFLIVGVVAGLLVPLLETPHFEAILSGWPEIAYGAFLGTGLAFTLQAIGQQYVPPANAAIILSSESLFAALGGAVVLGDRLSAIGYLGAGMIFVAILMVEAVPALATRRARAAPQPG